MDAFTPSIFDTRRPQIFPTLEPAEIERVRRFGETRTFGAGEALSKAGDVGHGLTVILSGNVDVTQRRDNERSRRPQPGHNCL